MWIGAISLAALLGAPAATDSNAVRIVQASGEAKSLELPRAAVVTERDRTGQRWEVTGELPAALGVARKDFEIVLGRQGWKLKHTIPTSVPGQRSELQTWIRRDLSLLLMLSEDAPAKTSFSLGRTATR